VEANKIVEEKLKSVEWELTNLKKTIAILEGELLNKEKVNFDLVTS